MAAAAAHFPPAMIRPAITAAAMIAATIQPGPGMKAHTAAATPAAKATLPAQVIPAQEMLNFV